MKKILCLLCCVILMASCSSSSGYDPKKINSDDRPFAIEIMQKIVNLRIYKKVNVMCKNISIFINSVLTEDTLMEMGSTKCIVYEGIVNNETFHKLLQNINEINALHTEKDIHILFGVSIPDT